MYGMKDERVPILLNLTSLTVEIPALTPALGGMLAEAAAVCFANQGHGENCLLLVQWDSEQHPFILHRFPVSEVMSRAYRDMQETTELGACGVAILVVRELTGYSVIERSVKGTGFDYWMGAVNDASTGLEPLERKARLEVSGILSGETAVGEARVREKIRQTRRSVGEYPAYIIVVEFGTPQAWMEQDG